MKQPLVSVSMVTYNQREYIERTIESILNQRTDFPFEIVIGEDCSTDGTREIVLEYAEKFPDIIKAITSERNVGFHENAYRTSMACSGKYIAWCDGDDYWHRMDKLQIQADYLERHPECGLVHSDQDRLFEEHGIQIKSFFEAMDSVPPESFSVLSGWKGYNILTCTAMAHTAAVQEIIDGEALYRGVDYIGGTDIPMFIEISMNSSVHYIPQSLATYVVRQSSACHFTDIRKQVEFTKSVTGCYLHLARKYNVQDEVEVLEREDARIRLNHAMWHRDIAAAKELRQAYQFDARQRLVYMATQSAVLGHVLKTLITLRNRYNHTRERTKLQHAKTV